MRLLAAARLLCLSYFLLQNISAAGQDGDKLINPISIGIRGHYGFIVPHSESIAEISDSNPWGIEADLGWHLMREKIWKHCYCYPRTGFSLKYINFGYPEVLGYSIGFNPYIEPFIRPQRKISLSFRFGMGPAWVSRIYDAETNPDNFFFSSHLSFIVLLNAALNYRPNGRLTTRVAFNYNHISNGGIKRPNAGMNFPTLNAGFDYSLREVSFPRRAKDTVRILYPDRCWWNAYILGTMKNVGKDENKNYPVLGAGIYYNILVGRILALNLGTELVSDFSEKERIRREYILEPATAPGHHRAAVLMGINFLFGRFYFVHQWGVYYYAPYPARKPVYQRYGLNVRFTERFYLGINIKSHGHVADLMDARMGILF